MDDEHRRLMREAIRARQSGDADAEQAALALLMPLMADRAAQARALRARATANVVNDN